MAKNTPLRADETVLAQSRSQFIQSLENKKQFEQECAVIIPELDRQWKEKILTLLGYSFQEDAAGHEEAVTTHSYGSQPGTWRRFGLDETHVINWKHYLYNYTPQLLSKAITRLASRLKFDPVNKTVENSRGKVENVSAYFKALVQDMRKAEVRREVKGGVRRSAVLNVPVTYQVGEVTSWGIVTRVDRITVFGCPAAYVLDKGILLKVECSKCFDEEGSYACIRPAHKGRQADVSIETVAADLMENSKPR